METNGLALDRQKSSLEASSRVKTKGSNFRNSKNGSTLLHEASATTPTAVFVYARGGVPVNSQNFDGDTALHLAVRRGNRSTSRALLMCGADLSLRNKLGQSPGDEAIGPMKELLHQFRPGLVTAVTKAEPAAIQRLTRLWCDPRAKVKDGKSALELLEPRINSEEGACRCYNYLKDHLHTLELVHAALADDLEALRDTLEKKKGWNANIRFRDKEGMTPLSCAVEQNNLEMVRLLVDSGKGSVNVRVRKTENEPETVPLCFKSLDASCSHQLWAFIAERMDTRQDSERDPDGNTAIFRAILNGKDANFISALLKHKNGLNITDRNMAGETPREAAERLGMTDIVKVIDEYLIDNSDKGLLINLPLTFYGKQHTKTIKSKEKSLKDHALEGKNELDIHATCHYSTIEKQGRRLFENAIAGNVKAVAKQNTAIYRDKNGYTALTKAIVFNQSSVAEMLITEKPQLRLVPDNKNRYPLHYAYILPEGESQVFRRILLRQNPEEVEHCVDKDGRTAAEFGLLRNTQEAEAMLEDARALDPYARRSDSTLPPSLCTTSSSMVTTPATLATSPATLTTTTPAPPSET